MTQRKFVLVLLAGAAAGAWQPPKLKPSLAPVRGLAGVLKREIADRIPGPWRKPKPQLAEPEPSKPAASSRYFAWSPEAPSEPAATPRYSYFGPWAPESTAEPAPSARPAHLD